MKKKNKILNTAFIVIGLIIGLFSLYQYIFSSNESFGWFMISLIYFGIPFFIFLYLFILTIINKKWLILLGILLLIPILYYIIDGF